MADLDRVKRNVLKMVTLGAPEGDIDSYIAEEGVTLDAVRAHKIGSVAAEPAAIAPTEALPQHGAADAAMGGWLDTLTFGTADELAAGIEYGLNKLPGGNGKSYDELLTRVRAELGQAQEDNPSAYLGGQIAGGVGQGVGLARAGLSAATNAARAGQSLGRVAIGSAKDGAIVGALHGAGSGEGIGGRLYGAGLGGVAGGAIGLGAPYAVAGATGVARRATAPLVARMRPESFANDGLSTALQRSGKSVDEVVGEMETARLDGQDAFTLADALGNSGQRMLSTVVRTPNDARQGIARTIQGRQLDQGRRVAAALSDASGTPMTAQQYKEALENIRATEADINYAPVRSERAPINVSEAVGRANRSISPLADQFARSRGAVPTDLATRAPIEAGERALRDPIREVVRQARSYLASDDLTVTNVAQAFRAKVNIDGLIREATKNGRGAEVAELLPVQQALDDALARTSPRYAAARDAYQASSARVDAVDAGRRMASGRTRIDDNLAGFTALPDDGARQAARVGYFDPFIQQAESLKGTMSNAARPYSSESARRELPVFAAPGEGDRLMARLGREQTMSETTNAALGGSKTADNVADLEDMANFDPAILARLFAKDWAGAGVAAVMRMVNESRGLPPRVVEQIGNALMQTDPVVAKRLLTVSTSKSLNDQGRRAATTTVLNSLTGATVGRLAAQ